ncbi:hypothetical protein LSAT2_032824 [Lamellibrachia satsuma]|nr:hypothetical protein LSAT2_032824 [Lamellibrachia satsuma]
MAQQEQDEIWLVDSEIAQQRSSFALDIGASLAKVVYRSNKDYKDGKPIFTQEDPNVGRLRLAMLKRFEPEVLIQFIKDNCDRTEDASSPCCIPATGCGSSIYRQQLEQGLNIKVEQMLEWDCFAAGLRFLRNNDSRQSLCLETSATGETDGVEKATTAVRIMASLHNFSDMKAEFMGRASQKEMQARSTSDNGPLQNTGSSTGTGNQETPAANASTCILVVIGTGASWVKIGGPGSLKTIHFSASAGGMFVSLGRLLTRSSKTFLELIDLAKRGDPSKVNLCGSDLKSDSDQSDMYSTFVSNIADIAISNFGQALIDPQGDFKDDDLIASLLDTACIDFIRITRLLALVSGQEKVYLAGNFVSNDYVRRIMTREVICGELQSEKQGGPEIRFLRHGGYLGAIGAMVADAKKPTNEG